MKRLLLFTILFFSFSLYGQETIKTKDKRFFIGVIFSPDYSYRNLTKKGNSLSDNQWNEIKNYMDSIEISKFGYTSGINFLYQFNTRWSAETGIQYSNKGYQISSILTSSIEYPEDRNLANILYSYNYIDIPFKANYSFINKRINLFVSIGAILNININSTIKYIPDIPTPQFKTHTKDNNYPYNKINISPTIGFGLNYKINDRMKLSIEPAFRYGILNIDNSSYSTMHLWSTGLNFGYYVGLW